MDIRLALMSGVDIPIPDCQLIAHQPTIKEISYVGEQDYFIGVQCLCVNKNTMLSEDKSLLTDTSNFQIFMTIMSEKETADKKASVLQTLSLVFPNAQIVFTPHSVILNYPEKKEQKIIDENNFSSFQDILREIFCISSLSNGQDNFNPASKQAEEIAKKLLQGRKKVAQLKGEDNSSMLSRYVSIITIGLHSISLNDALNLTLFQLYDLIERYSLYMNWDLDIRSKLAGGSPDSKPDNWMKNIH